MTSFDDKIWGLSILSWILIIIILVFFVYKVFYNNSDYDNSGAETFEETNADVTNSNVKVYNFNTSWCGWSVKFQPEWNEFAKAVKADSKLSSKVDVIDVKCDNPENENLCEKYKVPGYPYVVVDNNGNLEAYSGERTAKALLSFVSSK